MAIAALATTLRGFLTAADLAALAPLCAAPDRAWTDGRQATGYLRSAISPDDAATLAPLITRSLAALGVDRTAPHDLWLLRYPDGAHIPPHVDPPPDADRGHHRLNAIIAAPRAGGVLCLDGHPHPLGAGDAIVFRPDQQVHELSAVGGERLVWSVGCLRPAAPARTSAMPG